MIECKIIAKRKYSYYAFFFKYTEELSMQFSNIYGAKFSPKDNSAWLVSTENMIGSEQIEKLKKQYDIKFTPEAEEILKNTLDLIRRNYSLSSSTMPTRDIRSEINWDIPFEPYPIQLAGIQYMVENKRCFNGDDMGLGKTMQTIISLELIRGSKKVVVICPNVAVRNWRKEINMWSNNASSVAIGKVAGFPPETDYIVLNYESLKKHLNYLLADKSIGCLVVDESHLVKNPKSKRFLDVRKLSKQCDIVYCLSGTILENKAYDFIPQLQIIKRINDFGGQGAFIMKHCATFSNGVIDRNNSKNLDILNNNLRKYCMVRRLKKQFEENLPKKIIQPIRFTMKNPEEYDSASGDITSHLIDKKIEKTKEQYSLFYNAEEKKEFNNLIDMFKNEEEMYLQVIEELKYLSALGKVENVLKYVNEILERHPTNKVILFANRIELQEIYRKRIPNALSISGGMDANVRSKNERLFLENPENRVIICSQKAANSAITLTSANYVIVTEFAWTYSIHAQEFDRAYRIGQHRDVYCLFMISRDTVDELAYKIIMEKKEIMDKSLNGEVDNSVEKSVIENVKVWLRQNNIWN